MEQQLDLNIICVGRRTRQRVTLEHELELIAGSFDARQSRAAARIYYRWARQLFRKAKILDFHDPSLLDPSRPRVLRPLSSKLQALN
jgi:hypothetical protein